MRVAPSRGILTNHVMSPAAWSGKDLRPDSSWVYSFSNSDVQELETALKYCTSTKAEDITRFNFPLPLLSQKLASVAEGVEHGRGLYLLRNFPVSRWSIDETRRAFWGLGLSI
jgi:hypothetical protein